VNNRCGAAAITDERLASSCDANGSNWPFAKLRPLLPCHTRSLSARPEYIETFIGKKTQKGFQSEQTEAKAAEKVQVEANERHHYLLFDPQNSASPRSGSSGLNLIGRRSAQDAATALFFKIDRADSGNGGEEQHWIWLMSITRSDGQWLWARVHRSTFQASYSHEL